MVKDRRRTSFRLSGVVVWLALSMNLALGAASVQAAEGNVAASDSPCPQLQPRPATRSAASRNAASARKKTTMPTPAAPNQCKDQLVEYQRLAQGVLVALGEYKSALERLTAAPRPDPVKEERETRQKLLEIIANGGLAVAAIFFGFLGLLVGLLPAATDAKVGSVYFKATVATGFGVLASLGASLSAIAALWRGWHAAVVFAIVFGGGAALLVIGVTGYFLIQLLWPART